MRSARKMDNTVPELQPALDTGRLSSVICHLPMSVPVPALMHQGPTRGSPGSPGHRPQPTPFSPSSPAGYPTGHLLPAEAACRMNAGEPSLGEQG